MNVSLCIPRVNKMYNYSFIYNTINKYKIGEIEDIAILKKNKFNKVYINFYYWYSDSDRNNKLFQHLNNGGSIKIFYNEPYFWNCYKAQPKKKLEYNYNP